jgi:hypothetical protein
MSIQNDIYNSFEISTDNASALIAAFVYEAYNTQGDNDHMVASEILRLADLQDATALTNPRKLSIVENILTASGGTRAHQSKFQFTMKVGS